MLALFVNFWRPCFECKVVALISADNQFTMGGFSYREDSETLKFNAMQLSLCQESTFWLYQRAGLLDKQINCYGSSIVWFCGTQSWSSIRSFSIIMVPSCLTTIRLFSSMRWYINRMIFNSIESLSSWFDKRLSIHFVIRSAAIVHEFVHRLSISFCRV